MWQPAVILPERARFRMGCLWWKRPVRMTVGPALWRCVLLLLQRWTSGRSLLVRRSTRWRSHAGWTHWWAHVVGRTHRRVHTGAVTVALGRCRTRGTAIAAFVLQMLLKIVQRPW